VLPRGLIDPSARSARATHWPPRQGLVCLAHRPYRHPVPKIPKWLPSLHDPSPPRLWRIGYALALCFVAAVAGLAVLWVVALVLLDHPTMQHKQVISVRDTVGVAQLVFASVAGAGALVALVVAYRRQRVAEDRSTVFNERFATAATQLGDSQPEVRLAGAYAMAGLADDWVENRQTCVDVLCAYLRLPYDPDPGERAASTKRAAYRANWEVRHTIIRLIGRHLRPGAAESWQGYDLDFTGVVFDGGDFSGAKFSGGQVSFSGAKFSGGLVLFSFAEFSGSQVSFEFAEFSGGVVTFNAAKFSGGLVSFESEFSGGLVRFDGAEFSGGQVSFDFAKFSGGQVSFLAAKFGGDVGFAFAKFSGGKVSFESANFSGGKVTFGLAEFSGGQVLFRFAEFSGGKVGFDHAKFSGGKVGFAFAKFSGGKVSFESAEFSGSEVDFSARDWSVPPEFPWKGKPPPGVKLPKEGGQSHV
jgi:uncharacterized protein YjbI with pentapeptide repeats